MKYFYKVLGYLMSSIGIGAFIYSLFVILQFDLKEYQTRSLYTGEWAGFDRLFSMLFAFLSGMTGVVLAGLGMRFAKPAFLWIVLLTFGVGYSLLVALGVIHRSILNGEGIFVGIAMTIFYAILPGGISVIMGLIAKYS